MRQAVDSSPMSHSVLLMVGVIHSLRQPKTHQLMDGQVWGYSYHEIQQQMYRMYE